MALGHRGAKSRQIGLFEIARRRVDVKAVAQRLGPAVHGKVLARGHGAQVIQIVALHPVDKGDAHVGRSGTDLRRRFPVRVPSADRERC